MKKVPQAYSEMIQARADQIKARGCIMRICHKNMKIIMKVWDRSNGGIIEVAAGIKIKKENKPVDQERLHHTPFIRIIGRLCHACIKSQFKMNKDLIKFYKKVQSLIQENQTMRIFLKLNIISIWKVHPYSKRNWQNQ